MTSSPIVIRDVEEADAAFIFDSWTRCWGAAQRMARQHISCLEMRVSDFYAFARAGIDRILHDPDVAVRVGCLPDVPDEICGYIVARPAQGRVDWVFVRSPYRRIGLARRLFKDVLPSPPSQLLISYITPPVVSIKHAGKIDLRYIPA